MFQRDFLLNEARRFAEMLARLMGLKAEGRVVEFNRQAENLLQQEYDATLEEMVCLSADDFKHKIDSYSKEKLDALSQILYVFAEPFNYDEETASLLKKVLAIFEAMEQKHHQQSFDTISKQNNIHQYFIKYARS